MPTITAQTIVDRAQITLQDTTAVRWSEAELLGWLNAGQREVCMLRPSAFTKLAAQATVAGTKQALPADGITVIDVTRNMGANGTTPGRAIRKVPREVLDSNVPGWHTVTATAEVLHWTFDPQAPKTFYLYPPSTGANQVEVLYAATPPEVALGAVISIDDIYEQALMDYVLYRAYSKDSGEAAIAARAAAHRTAFENSLGLKAQADAAAVKQPNVRG